MDGGKRSSQLDQSSTVDLSINKRSVYEKKPKRTSCLWDTDLLGSILGGNSFGY